MKPMDLLKSGVFSMDGGYFFYLHKHTGNVMNQECTQLNLIFDFDVKEDICFQNVIYIK